MQPRDADDDIRIVDEVDLQPSGSPLCADDDLADCADCD